jgi:hypothetical protein
MADSNLPAKFDRTALERVLARASELQGSTGEQSEALSEQQLVELGKEVGIPVEHLQQAIAEEKSRAIAGPEVSTVARVFGTARGSAERTIKGTPAEVLALIDAWMIRQEGLRVKRKFPQRIVWEPLSGVIEEVVRGVQRAMSGSAHALRGAYEVSAFVQPVDATRVLVRLDVDLQTLQKARVWGGAGATASIALTSVVLGVLGVMLPVAIIPALAAPIVGWSVARTFRGQVARAQLALEQLLDRLDSGELRRTPSLLDVLKNVALPPVR